jgi:translin
MNSEPVSKQVAELGQNILGRLELTNFARDRALNEGRQIVRLSANTVRAVHRGEIDIARNLLEDARSMLGSLTASIAEFPAIRWAGYVQDAMKEFGEASITLAIVAGNPLPSPEELDIDDAPYLNGLAESASELRRLTLDMLRSGQFDAAERYLQIMDEVYAFLTTVDYPDGITGGLRRTTDALRAVLERTRGDLTITGAQNRLHAALEESMALCKASSQLRES